MQSKKRFQNILIVTDLDGTFFGKSGAVLERNTEAIRRFEEQGGHFTVATGRNNLNIRQKWQDVAHYVNAPVISCNGGMLCDIRNGEVIARRLMDREEFMQLVRFAEQNYPDLGGRISVEQGFLTSGEMIERCPRLEREMSAIPAESLFILPSSEWLSIPDWYKAVFRGSEERVDSFRSDAERQWQGKFEISKSGASFLEFQSAGTTKAAMLPCLREWTEKEVGGEVTLYACGDYENDIQMLLSADVAVCPENALDKVKEIADLCLCHHTEGLIAHLIEYLESK